MSVIARVGPQVTFPQESDRPGLAVVVGLEGEACVVFVSGELDLATRDTVVVAAKDAERRAMIVDLDAVTFMDCAGYGCLAECRLVLEGSGRTLTIRGQTGQPARLLAMIAAMGHANDVMA